MHASSGFRSGQQCRLYFFHFMLLALALLILFGMSAFFPSSSRLPLHFNFWPLPAVRGYLGPRAAVYRVASALHAKIVC